MSATSDMRATHDMCASRASGAPGATGATDAAVAPWRHRRRAAIATRLLHGAPDAAATLDWEALDNGPDWLAAPDADLIRMQRRIGAFACASAIRLWIDRRRIAEACAAVGDAVLREALAARDAAQTAPPWPTTMPEPGGDVAEWLRTTGAAVQAAAVADTALGRTVALALCGCADGALPMAPAVARDVVARAAGVGVAASAAETVR